MFQQAEKNPAKFYQNPLHLLSSTSTHENLSPPKSDHCITNPILSDPLPVIASPRSQWTSVAKTIPKFTASAAAVYPQPVPMSTAVRAA